MNWKFKLVVCITMIFLCGCFKTTTSSNFSKEETVNKNFDSEITGKAIDGYVSGATVCLDLNLDGECQENEPNGTTNLSGSYKLNIFATFKGHENYLKAPVIIYGGIDNDTDLLFDGKLKSMPDGNNIVNATPITTIIESLHRSGMSFSNAKELVRNVFDVDDSIKIDADPVALVKNDSSLINKKFLAKNVALQKAIDSILNFQTQS